MRYYWWTSINLMIISFSLLIGTLWKQEWRNHTICELNILPLNFYILYCSFGYQVGNPVLDIDSNCLVSVSFAFYFQGWSSVSGSSSCTTCCELQFLFIYLVWHFSCKKCIWIQISFLLADACLVDCSFCGADLRSAHLQVYTL